MVANVSGLTPRELSVYEVYRRLRNESLPDPTISTVTDLSRMNYTQVKMACDQLVQRGLLEFGGKTKKSYRLPDDFPLKLAN